MRLEVAFPAPATPVLFREAVIDVRVAAPGPGAANRVSAELYAFASLHSLVLMALAVMQSTFTNTSGAGVLTEAGTLFLLSASPLPLWSRVDVADH